MTAKEVLNKIIPNIEIDIPLSKHYFDELSVYEKEKGKWYLKSWDSQERELLVYNEKTDKKAPEEIVRQLFLFELIDKYKYPKERIKTEITVKFGRDDSKRADIVVYQNDNYTPWLLIEIKAPKEKNDIEQLKGYLNAEGSPIGIGYNGKNITRFIRPYPKEFELLADIPTDDEYQTAINSENPVQKIKELIANRKWTIDELNKLNEEKDYDLREIIEELEELVLGNSGHDSFEEIFKLIYTKLYDENKAITSGNKTLYFRDYSETKITHKKISDLFDNAKQYWRDVFEPTEKIKLTPAHLEACINKLQEVKLFGANLRIIDEAFEYLVTAVSKGNKGQYFTPRVVIDATVKMLNPTDQETILDPACGSAGFLIHAMEYVWDKYNMNEKGRSMYADRYLWGVDFDEKASKISRAIMLIAGDGKTHIFKQNSLDYKNWDSKLIGNLSENWLIEDEKDPRKLNFDIVLSNPPFAGEINQKAIINNYSDLTGYRYTLSLESKNILSIFKDFAKEFNLEYVKDSDKKIKEIITSLNKDKEINLEDEADINQAIETLANILSEIIKDGEADEMLLRARLKNIKIVQKDYKWNKAERHILFIQRIIDSLKDGGRAVIVLPQGIFNNTSEEYVRKYITSKARILGVVGLHVNSFKPHTGTKTSLLFIRKFKESETKNEIKDYPIFFATSTLSFKDNSGRYKYVLDENESRVTDEKGNPLFETDIYDISQAFLNFGIEQYENGDKDFDFVKGLKKKAIKFNNSVINFFQIESNLRFEPEFYNPIFLDRKSKLSKLNCKKLSEIADIYSGLAYSSKLIQETKTIDTEIPIVKIGNVTRKTKYEDLDFVDFANISSNQLLQNDDILMTMTGDPPDVGKCNIWFSRENEQSLTYNQRVCRIVSKNTVLSPLQLYVFLNTEYARYHSERYAMGIRQRNVSINDIRNIEIPIFSSDLNNLIENVIKDYFISLQTSKSLYQEATNILFKSLGINEWKAENKDIRIKDKKYKIENTENNKTFSKVNNTRRFDAEYWLPKYEQLTEKINTNCNNILPISELQLFNNRGFQPNYSEDGEVSVVNSRHILETELDYDNFEKTDKENLIKQKRAVLEKYDILTYTTGANIGRTNVYLKDDLAIGSNHVNILRVDRNPIYVGFVMNSIVGRYQTERLATGTAQAELYPSDVNSFEIPFIKQTDIENIEELLLSSFENGNKSKGLIELSRQVVDLAIEKGEKEAIKLIEKYKDE